MLHAVQGRFSVAALLLAGVLALGLARPAHAADAAPAACKAGQTDDTLRLLQPALVPAARQAFGLSASMPDALIQQTTVYRCDAGKTLMCTAGANLPCGPADTAKTSDAANEWCASHANASFVPAFVTGHTTAYEWSCRGTKAVPGKEATLDDRGFFQDYWKPAP